MKYTRKQKAQARMEAQAQLASQAAPDHLATPLCPNDPTPVFFHREYEAPYGFLSQWFLSPFHDPATNTTYNCAEQRRMHHKALLCSDTAAAHAILASGKPGEQKSLGRKVKGWEEKGKEWERIKFEVVVQGSWLKFEHGERWLRERLVQTGERELVEASPGDRVWGVGFGAAEAEGRREEWGMNLLGKALMTVRERIRGGAGVM